MLSLYLNICILSIGYNVLWLIFFYYQQIYNGRLFYGGGPGIVHTDNSGPVSSSVPLGDKRGGRSRGMVLNQRVTWVITKMQQTMFQQLKLEST